MYYCIKCKELHDNGTAVNIFRTGFYTLKDKATAPLGICSKQSVSQPA